MIAENRLKAKLDQITKIIDISDGKFGKIISLEELILIELESYSQWTRGIHDFCTKVDRLLNKVKNA